MTHYSHSDSEYDHEISSVLSQFRIGAESEMKENRSKRLHGAKELRRLQKRRQARQEKFNATANALLNDADEQEQRIDAAVSAALSTRAEKLNNTSTSTSSDDEEAEQQREAQMRLEKILRRQAAKKALQLQRKSKGKQAHMQIRNGALKKQEQAQSQRSAIPSKTQ